MSIDNMDLMEIFKAQHDLSDRDISFGDWDYEYIEWLENKINESNIAQWIKTSDKMPRKYKMVIINFKGKLHRIPGKVTEGWWNGEYWSCYACDQGRNESITVAKWMEKPNP